MGLALRDGAGVGERLRISVTDASGIAMRTWAQMGRT
jgi:hypothetical protein